MFITQYDDTMMWERRGLHSAGSISLHVKIHIEVTQYSLHYEPYPINTKQIYIYVYT